MYAVNLNRPQPARTQAHRKYVIGGAKGLGASHIVFGCLLITMGSIGAALNTADFYIGTHIWTGLMYLVTGILGVVSSHRNNKCTAVGFLVLSCMCILMVIAGLTSASLALSWEHWSVFSGPVGCWYDYQTDENHCKGIDTARSAVDAATLLGALVEMGLCIASIVVCSHAISKVRREGVGGGEGCGSGCSCCEGGRRGQSAYQTLHEVGPDGRLQVAPVKNFSQLQFHSRPQMALAPGQSYVISTQVPASQGGLEQGATGGTQTVELAHAQQQQTMQYHQPPQQQQQQIAAAMAHVQQGCTSPPPAYNNHSEC